MIRRKASEAITGLALTLALVPVAIGQATVAGVVISSSNARIAGGALSAGATVFSGDLLSTEAEGQIQIQAGRTKLALQANSSLRVFRLGEQVMVELEHGSVNYTTEGENLVLYALDARFVPARGGSATGQVTIVSRCEVKATAQTNTIKVSVGQETKIIDETKTYSVRSDFGIEYHDSWKPIPADYPDFDPSSAYHRSHSHSACGLAENQGGHPPNEPLTTGHFKIVAAVIGGVAVCLVLCRGSESPDRP